MTAKIFIDGEVGTTGLQIRARLEGRSDVSLLSLDEAVRKDASARRDAHAEADVSILCLPDDAAREAVALIDDPDARVIDASTAHRTADGWLYGFAEMTHDQGMRIADARRVSNPGCYALSSVALLRPLVSEGLVPSDFPVTINAVSGYTGGGKALIERMESPKAADAISSDYFVYGLGLEHKHVPEIQVRSLLDHRPLFVPSVGRFRQGMIVQVPLQLDALPGTPTADAVHACLADWYRGRTFVSVADPADAAAHVAQLDPEALNWTNHLHIYVFGNAKHGQAVLAAVSDNLGKGAAGSAVQNMNLMLGFAETTGLEEPLKAA